MNPSRESIATQNLHAVSKQTLGDVLTVVLNQVSNEGDVSHLGFVKSGKWGVLMVHKLMRVTTKQINFFRFQENCGEKNLVKKEVHVRLDYLVRWE